MTPHIYIKHPIHALQWDGTQAGAEEIIRVVQELTGIVGWYRSLDYGYLCFPDYDLSAWEYDERHGYVIWERRDSGFKVWTLRQSTFEERYVEIL